MATVYKRGKTYWIKWYEGGVAKYESLKTTEKRDALIAKAAKELELRTGTRALDANITTEEFAKRYLAWHKGEFPWAAKEMEYYIDNTLLPVFGKKRLASLDAGEVEAWKHSRLNTVGHRSKKKLSRATVNNELKRLRAVVNKAVEWGVIERNPIKGVKTLPPLVAKPRTFFTREQLAAIYQQDPEFSPVFQLMANTGMRIGEAVFLRWEDVLPKAIRILSTDEHFTKTRKWRDIPLSPGASSALAMLRGKDDVYVLGGIPVRTLRGKFQRACRRAGIEGTPHELRHTFISQLVMQGVPLRTVQVLAGHSSIATTEKYSHLSPDYLASAVRNLEL